MFDGGLKGKKIRFLGIGGVGVNALAKYALQEGAIVTGSDRKPNNLCSQIVSAGGRVFAGEDGNFENIDAWEIKCFGSKGAYWLPLAGNYNEDLLSSVGGVTVRLTENLEGSGK